jgi:hypothetical protein
MTSDATDESGCRETVMTSCCEAPPASVVLGVASYPL